VAEGKIRKQKSLPEVDDEEKPFALPLSWKWVRFDSISNTRLGKMLDKAKNKGELRPYLRNTNVQWFNFEISDLKSMRFEEHELDEYRINPGDLVICEGGEPGRCAVWQGEVEDMFIQKALHRARPWLGISPFFLQFCLKAAAHSGFLDQFFTGATIKHFSGEKLAKYPVPLPPLAEQHRIVAKVDQLMALCNQLKTRLTQTRQLNEQLASSLVEQAVT
jgi:type I restriction enzyme S subunit